MIGSGKRMQDLGLMLVKQLRGVREIFLVAIFNCKGRGLMPWEKVTGRRRGEACRKE